MTEASSKKEERRPRSRLRNVLSVVRKVAMFAVAIILISGCGTMQPKIQTVASVDLEQFMGDWYVVGHIPTFIEKQAFDAIERYELNDDGTIATTFTFNKGEHDGPAKRYTPKGFVCDGTNSAEWRMRFVWPLKSEFLIAHLDEAYTETIVARSRRDYVWIMTRSPEITQEAYERLVGRVGEMGYDVSKVRRVPHRSVADPSRQTPTS